MSERIIFYRKHSIIANIPRLSSLRPERPERSLMDSDLTDI
ncbi:MAG: hypothetical protein ACPG70_07595 [Candidatus Puniceispirillaceae bacterium]